MAEVIVSHEGVVVGVLPTAAEEWACWASGCDVDVTEARTMER